MSTDGEQRERAWDRGSARRLAAAGKKRVRRRERNLRLVESGGIEAVES